VQYENLDNTPGYSLLHNIRKDDRNKKSRAVFNAERREIISDEGEPTYYKLFSDAELTSAKFREVKKIFLKTISQHNS
jgi:hypothetical protein